MPKALPLFAINPEGSLAENGPLMLYTRLSEVLYYSAHIGDPKNVAELHSMRIAAKRLRYTLEVFAPAYDARKAEYLQLLDRVKRCQEQIGDIHDCDVRIVEIRDYLNQNVVKKPEIRIGLHNLIERETATRDSLYGEFIGYWNNLVLHDEFEKTFVEVVFSVRIDLGKPSKSLNGKVSVTKSAGGS